MKKLKFILLSICAFFLLGLVSHLVFSFLQKGNPDLNPFLAPRDNVIRIWVGGWVGDSICYTAVQNNEAGLWRYSKFQSEVFSSLRSYQDFKYTYVTGRDFCVFDEHEFDLKSQVPINTAEYLYVLSPGIEEKHQESPSEILDGRMYSFYLKRNGVVTEFSSANIGSDSEERNLKILYSLVSHLQNGLKQ